MAYFLMALVGLIVGSFLNVCIYRLPRGLSVVWPASRCTMCGRAINWYENIPVLSYAVLRGRCRTCGERISLVYPIVELVTAAAFVATYATFGVSWLLAIRLVFVAAMIVLLVVDLEHQILPNEITLPGIVVGLAASLVAEPGPASALAGAVAGGGLLWLVAWGYERLRHQQGMGFGDVKMLAMIGAFLGWKLMLLTLVVGSLAGSLAAVGLLAARRADWQSKLPLGTFLALAAIPVALAGDLVIAWYAGFFR